MPTAKLIKSRSLHTQGHRFMNGVETPVSFAVAKELENDLRFEVKFQDGEVDDTPDEEPGGRPANKADRLAAIQDAIGQLDDDNDDHFTAEGKPDARALTSILGWQVTAKERDEAMDNEIRTGETLGGGVPTPKKGGPILQPGGSSETPVRGRDTGDVSTSDLKNPRKKSSSTKGTTEQPAPVEQTPPEQTDPNLAGPQPEASEAPSETGEEQQEEVVKKVGGVTLKKKHEEPVDPTTEGAKDV